MHWRVDPKKGLSIRPLDDCRTLDFLREWLIEGVFFLFLKVCNLSVASNQGWWNSFDTNLALKHVKNREIWIFDTVFVGLRDFDTFNVDFAKLTLSSWIP